MDENFCREGTTKRIVERTVGVSEQDLVFEKLLDDKTTNKMMGYRAQVSSNGIHANKTGVIDSLDNSFWPYRFQDIVGDIYIGGDRIYDLLKKANPEVLSQKLDGTLCWVFQGEHTDMPHKYELWINPEINFMPLLVKRWHSDGEFEFEVNFKNYEEIFSGIWFPKVIESKFNRKEQKIEPDTNTTTYNTYVITSIKVNTDLPDETFKVIFPSGTKVVDNIVDKEYIIP